MSDDARVLFVCLGNICRSPTAEAVFKKLVFDAGLFERIEIDSAGTGAWHVGEQADRRSREAAAHAGYRIDSIARQVRSEDLERFHYVLAMDRQNRQTLVNLAKTERERSRVFLFREFDANAPRDAEVPDPYYGGEDGFKDVLRLCEAAARGLLERVRKDFRLR